MNKFYDIYDFSLFAGADKENIEIFLQNAPSRITSYKEGDIIALQDTECRSLMLLCQGNIYAKMTNSEGKEITVEVLHAPEILAPAFIYGSENRLPVTLQAQDDVKIWSLAKDKFINLMETDSAVLHNFIMNISDRSVFLSKKLNEFALQNLNTRIIGYLKQNNVISNIQEVAFILGVARPSLSRTLSAMTEEGFLKKTSKGYELSQEII